MSYMEQVAKMLGVEIEEKFKIEGKGKNSFFFTENDFFTDNSVQCRRLFYDLVHGDLKIIKFP